MLDKNLAHDSWFLHFFWEKLTGDPQEIHPKRCDSHVWNLSTGCVTGWVIARYWRWWNIWMPGVFVAYVAFVRNVGFRDGNLSPHPIPWERDMRWCVLNGEDDGQVQVLHVIFGGPKSPKIARALRSFVLRRLKNSCADGDRQNSETYIWKKQK